MINIIEVLPLEEQQAWSLLLQETEKIHADNFSDPNLILKKMLRYPCLYQNYQNVEVAYKMMCVSSRHDGYDIKQIYKTLSWYWLDKDPKRPFIGGLMVHPRAPYPIFSFSTELFQLTDRRKAMFQDRALGLLIDEAMCHKILWTAMALFTTAERPNVGNVLNSNNTEAYLAEITSIVHQGIELLLSFYHTMPDIFDISPKMTHLLDSLIVFNDISMCSSATFKKLVESTDLPLEEVSIIV